MSLASTFTLSVFAMFGFSAQPRMSERALADIAVIRMPRMVKDEIYKGIRLDQPGRITFSFGTTYFWASFGSSQAYKHQLFIALMAPDATEAEYREHPRNWSPSYDQRREIRRSALGSGSLTVHEGIYTQNALKEPAYALSYVDRTRRLHIAWHAVKKEITLEDAIAAMQAMVSSFRLKREPTAEWTEMRDMPRADAENRLRKRTLMAETLRREVSPAMQEGKPVLKDGVYIEWTTDPEPRVQLLLPLGRVRIPANATPVTRPRPVPKPNDGDPAAHWAGTVGWREHVDGEWTASNRENAYLPFPGISAELAKGEHDPAFVEFYYSATIRVEEGADDQWLVTLQWFFDDLPAVRKAWTAGRLTRP